MKNFIEPEDVITVATPLGGVVSGGLVVVGSLIGVATTTQNAGENVALATTGVFELPKVAADDISVGDKLYWSAGDSALTKVPGAGSKPLVGVAVKVAGVGVTKAYCRLMLTGQTGPA